MEELLNQIKIVAEARNKAQALSGQKSESYKAWEVANQGLLDALKTANDNVATEETMLREMTINVFNDTGNKTPASGVGIREVTKLEYDPKTALDWALEHKLALSLDKKAFEGIAKKTPIDFVNTHIEPQATIATDLNAVLDDQGA